MKQVLSLAGGTTLYQIGIMLLFQFICDKADMPTIADNAIFALSACPLQERTDCQRQVPPLEQGSRKVRQTFWERGRATQRLSFRIYAETI